MYRFHKKLFYCIALVTILGISPLVVVSAEQPNEKSVTVYINQVLKPYTLIKKITTEVYVLDAKSEEDAELQAFRELKLSAADFGADGLIEVKRYIIKDNIATRPATSVSGSMLKDDIDATAEILDELTLDSYERGKGTLSTTPIDQTFDRSKLSEKVIRFTGKAIKFIKK